MATVSEQEYVTRIAALEKWAPIPTAVTYQVSDAGRVRSLRFHNNQIEKVRAAPLTMKLTKRKRDGYIEVGLRINGFRRVRKVHQLVLEAFVGPCPAGMEVAHLNGDRSNNQLLNLKWATPSENNSHKIQHGTHRFGEQLKHAKLRRFQIPIIRQRLNKGESESSIAKSFGVSRSLINYIRNGAIWKQVPNNLSDALNN